MEVFFQFGGIKHKFVQGHGNGPLMGVDAAHKLFAAGKKKPSDRQPKSHTESLASIRATVAAISAEEIFSPPRSSPRK